MDSLSEVPTAAELDKVRYIADNIRTRGTSGNSGYLDRDDPDLNEGYSMEEYYGDSQEARDLREHKREKKEKEGMRMKAGAKEYKTAA